MKKKHWNHQKVGDVGTFPLHGQSLLPNQPIAKGQWPKSTQSGKATVSVDNVIHRIILFRLAHLILIITYLLKPTKECQQSRKDDLPNFLGFTTKQSIVSCPDNVQSFISCGSNGYCLYHPLWDSLDAYLANPGTNELCSTADVKRKSRWDTHKFQRDTSCHSPWTLLYLVFLDCFHQPMWCCEIVQQYNFIFILISLTIAASASKRKAFSLQLAMNWESPQHIDRKNKKPNQL